MTVLIKQLRNRYEIENVLRERSICEYIKRFVLFLTFHARRILFYASRFRYAHAVYVARKPMTMRSTYCIKIEGIANMNFCGRW